MKKIFLRFSHLPTSILDLSRVLGIGAQIVKIRAVKGRCGLIIDLIPKISNI